jgi:hypothetical protein
MHENRPGHGCSQGHDTAGHAPRIFGNHPADGKAVIDRTARAVEINDNRAAVCGNKLVVELKGGNVFPDNPR